MAANRLDGPRLKIERAKEHIEEFGHEWGAILEQDPYTTFSEDDPETGDLVYRASMEPDAPAKIQRLSVVIGDAIHNLRSALDLVAWQLVEVGGGKPGRWTYFPIADSWKEFESGGPKRVKGASEDAIDLIRRIRPYKGGNNALWRLHHLDIVDKHRLLLTVGSSYSSARVRYIGEGWESPEITLTPRERKFPIVDNTELYRVPASLRESAKKHPDPQFFFEIAFGEGEVVKGEPVIPILHQFVGAVEQVIELFALMLDPNSDLPF